MTLFLRLQHSGFGDSSHSGRCTLHLLDFLRAGAEHNFVVEDSRMHAINDSAILLFGVMISSHLVKLVLISAVLQWLLGWLWYGLIFKKSWMKLVGFAEGEKPKNGAMTMVASLIACLLLSYVLIHVIGWAGAVVFTGGAKLGVICWVGFMAPPLFTGHIAEGRRANLFAINAAYWLLAMALGGGIMAAFHG